MFNKTPLTVINIIFIIMLSFLASAQLVFSYSTDTHSYITKEIIDFYNKNSKNNAIDNELIPYLLDGARKEDDAPRFLNHFYDPINNMGLHRDTAIDPEYFLGSHPSSKEWAQNREAQNSLTYRISSTIASILTSIQKQRINKISTESDFTWEKAIKYWIQGEKEKAMYVLGHILHLIEDLSVPAHARNDSHPEGDLYEKFSSKFTLKTPDSKLLKRIDSQKIIKLEHLDNYFDEISDFSNYNFYSKDTLGIQSGYKNPTPDYEEMIGEYLFGTKKIKEEKVLLYIKEKPSLLSMSGNNKNISLSLSKKGSNYVLENNWEILSTKNIQYGAGVIDLFFKEVEKYKNNPEYTEKQTSFLGKIIDAVSGTINSIFNNNKEIASIPPENNNSDNKKLGENSILDYTAEKNTQKTKENKETNITTTKEEKKEINIDKYKDGYKVVRVIDGDTIILENGDIVRYLGIDAPEIDSDCYAEESKKENEKIVLGKRVLLEKAGNENKDNYGRLLRYVWIDNSLVNKSLIEIGAVKVFNFGNNHRLDNEFIEKQSIAKNKSLGLWGDSCNKKQEEIKENKQSEIKEVNTCSYNTNLTPSLTPVIINEVAWMGTTNSSSDEWIELYNTSSETIDINEWTLIDKDEQIKIVFGSEKETTKIPSKSYYLLERTDDNSVPNIVADAIYKGSLSNSNEGLRLFNSSCQLIDEVIAIPDWEAGASSDRRPMERNNSTLKWQTSEKTNGTPKNRNTNGIYSISGNPGPSGGSGTPTNNESDENNGGDEEVPENPSYGMLKINEIMYNPEGNDDGREWIEIKNISTSTSDLSYWNLYEQETEHRISTSTLTSSLEVAPGEIFIISDDVSLFLEDWPDYSKKVFDSSFSLNNTGETIALHLNEEEKDSYIYTNKLGADGNNNSLQLIDDTWTESKPTPGEENILNQSPTPPETAEIPNHILISEIKIEGENADDEFIELYNPTNKEIFLREYSMQYISGRATSTENIYKKNFNENASIKPYSFFLTTTDGNELLDNYDMKYNFSLSGLSSGANIIIVSTSTPIKSLSDANIIDGVSYGNTSLQVLPNTQLPESGKSIERKTIDNNLCVSPYGDGEYMGNSCDTNTNNDFEIREKPNPQNSSNLKEPREKPNPPKNFLSIYSPETLNIETSWEAPTSTSPAQSSNYYKIYDEDTYSLISTSTITNSSNRIYEVGRDYNLSLSFCDREGFCSNKSTTTLKVPSFINGLYIYKKEANTSTIAEIFYDKYPFIPDIYEAGDKWDMLLININKGPVSQSNIYETWEPEDKDNLLEFEYENCSGIKNYNKNSLIMPGDINFCGTSGGAYNVAMKINNIGENHTSTKVNLDKNTYYEENSPNNFATISFYKTKSTKPSDGNVPYFGLVATDATNYKIGEEPEHQPPIIEGDIELNFNESSSKLDISWDKSSDYDTLDELINYSIKYSSSSDWLSTGIQNDTSTTTSPGDSFSIYVKAVDEFGNESNIIGPVEWSYPEINYVFTQEEKNSTSKYFGNEDGTGTRYAVAQKIIPSENITFEKTETKIDHYLGSVEATLRLSIYPELNGEPDFSQEIAGADAHGLAIPGERDVVFNFESPVSLNSQTSYWFVVKIKNYYSNSGWGSNKWRIAISTQNPYTPGDYATLGIQNGNLANFSIKQGKDWYIKLSNKN